MKIKELIKNFEALKNQKGNIKVDATINKISSKDAILIKLKIGIDLTNYVRKIDFYGISHVLKNHGNFYKETKRGQIPVKLRDFELVEKIATPENIITKSKNKIGRDVIIYHGVIGNLFIYIEEIRTGRKELVLNSMYIKKAP